MKDWKEEFKRLKKIFGMWGFGEDGEPVVDTCPVCSINYRKLEDFISTLLEEARKEENERCVKIIREIIQQTAWEAPTAFFDGLHCAKNNIMIDGLTSKEEKK